MGRLIYSMISSLDGYASDASGNTDWGASADEQLHDFIAEKFASATTYLYGRRIYEMMTFWETALDDPSHPDFVRRFATVWQSAEKIVYSTTLDSTSTAKTTLERTFYPQAVRAMVDALDHDVTIEGPTLAAHALRAGIVDEVQPYVSPVSVGDGLRFLPADLPLNLDLLDDHRFDSGVVWLRYAVRKD